MFICQILNYDLLYDSVFECMFFIYFNSICKNNCCKWILYFLLLTQYTQVISTIQNADGTVSLIQVDPNNPIITLPDGTTAQVQGVATVSWI